MDKKYSVKEIDISLGKILIVILIGSSLCFGGIILDKPFLLVLGGITFLSLLTRKFAYADSDGIVNVKDYRIFKRYDKWSYNDIQSIKLKEDFSMDDCFLGFEQSMDFKMYTFSKEDASDIVATARENNKNIKVELLN